VAGSTPSSTATAARRWSGARWLCRIVMMIVWCPSAFGLPSASDLPGATERIPVATAEDGRFPQWLGGYSPVEEIRSGKLWLVQHLRIK
jgi:hypothetical protein